MANKALCSGLQNENTRCNYWILGVSQALLIGETDSKLNAVRDGRGGDILLKKKKKRRLLRASTAVKLKI